MHEMHEGQGGSEARGLVAGIVLAAGSARRFGSTKQLASLHGRPLVRYATECLRAAQVDRLLVVVGRDAEAVALAAGPGVIPVRNPEYAAGLSTSVKAGLRAAGELNPAVDVAVIILSDQPEVSGEVVGAIIEEARRTGWPSRARYTDAAGPPVALPRSCWFEVLELLSGDSGLGRFMSSLGVTEVEVGAPMPPDIDRVSDLEARQD